MRAFLSTCKNAGVPELEKTRDELDILGKQIIGALAKRKQYGFNSAKYSEKSKYIEANLRAELYLPILEILCENMKIGKKATSIDATILGLLQKRMSLGLKAARLKIKSNMPLCDLKREEEIYNNAEKDAKRCGIPPETARKIFKIIVKKTREVQEKLL
ncbi:MAG: chorismate mutase [Nanoarchaeota archaeon]|nr:chorismate mutase [Nanoarchaeota archaeon]